MDATSLGDRFVVLAISAVYRGCAVSVAWKVLKAEEKHAWKPEWQALLKRFQGLVPKGWTVIVLADRGLYAKWLFEAIVELTWHPFLRVNSQGTFGREGWYHWQPFSYWGLPRAAVGRDGESHLRARKANCAARCWATGEKNSKTLDWC